MSELGKQTELVNDPVDQMRKLMEKWDNRLTLDNLRLAERYLEGGLEIHVHIRVFAVVNVDATDFCAVLKNCKPLSASAAGLGHDGHALGGLLGGVVLDPANHGGATAERSNEQEAVFVDVVKLVKFPEDIIATLVRLERVEDAYRSRRHSLYFSGRVGFVFGSSLEDGKAGPVAPRARRSTVGQNQLPGQMVKTAPQVVQNLPDQQGDGPGDTGADLHPIDLISGLRVYLDSESIRVTFAEGLQPLFEITDVLFGPFDFCSDVA